MAFITPVGCIMDCYNQVKVRIIKHLRLHLSSSSSSLQSPSSASFSSSASSSSPSSSHSSSSSFFLFFLRLVFLVPPRLPYPHHPPRRLPRPPRPPRLHPPRPPRRFCGGIYKSNLLHIQQFVTRPTRSHFASSSMTCPICFGAVALDDPLAWGYSNPTWHPTWLHTSIPSC